MFALVISISVILIGLSLCAIVHLSGLTRELRTLDTTHLDRLANVERLLAELDNPTHLQLAADDPQFAREFLLYALDAIKRDLRYLLQTGTPILLLPQFVLFRFYLGLFRVKTLLRANLGDLEYLLGYQVYLIRRMT